MYGKLLACAILFVCICNVYAIQVFDMASFGIVPEGKNLSAKMKAALHEIHERVSEDSIVIRFQKGRYDFYQENASSRMYYISNHAEYRGEQKPLEKPLHVAIPLEDFRLLTVEGNGALFVCHGCMLPVSLVRSKNCTLQDIQIDFQEAVYPQIRILKNEGKAGITFEVFPDVDYRLAKDSVLDIYALGQWGIRPFYATAYEGETKRVAYNTGDLEFPNHSLVAKGKRVIHAPLWHDERLKPGFVMLLRTWDRPAPAVFLHHNVNTTLKNVEINYAEGMGVLAQLCENVTLDSTRICLSERNPSRYITTVVDATHFSHCRGKIVSTHGLYEHMGDDAINVHGIYLNMEERVDDYTVIGRFMYEQTYGFDWGFAGDTVQFVSKETSEVVTGMNRIVDIVPMDVNGSAMGARSFKIVFANPLDGRLFGKDQFCMENLTWTPEVCFAENLIRNNRARGALFTTPRRVVVDSNVFDHVSGAAILISGDCSYWYESGACRDVLICNNRFVNVLSSIFMEANAVISISPVVKNLQKQERCYHGGNAESIRIINNKFDVFDAPILYAKSVDGLLFKGNTIHINSEYVPFHWNQSRYRMEHVGRIDIEP